MTEVLNNPLRWQDQFFKELARPRTLLDLLIRFRRLYVHQGR